MNQALSCLLNARAARTELELNKASLELWHCYILLIPHLTRLHVSVGLRADKIDEQHWDALDAVFAVTRNHVHLVS